MKALDDREWIFRSHSDRLITVTADNEAEARDLAMRKLWGVQTSLTDRQGEPIMCAPYIGLGLMLQ